MQITFTKTIRLTREEVERILLSWLQDAAFVSVSNSSQMVSFQGTQEVEINWLVENKEV